VGEAGGLLRTVCFTVRFFARALIFKDLRKADRAGKAGFLKDMGEMSKN